MLFGAMCLKSMVRNEGDYRAGGRDEQGIHCQDTSGDCCGDNLSKGLDIQKGNGGCQFP